MQNWESNFIRRMYRVKFALHNKYHHARIMGEIYFTIYWTLNIDKEFPTTKITIKLSVPTDSGGPNTPAYFQTVFPDFLHIFVDVSHILLYIL